MTAGEYSFTFTNDDFLKGIDRFVCYDQYEAFRRALERHPDFIPTQPYFQSRYKRSDFMALVQKIPQPHIFWYDHKTTGRTWILVEPIHGFAGTWAPVEGEAAIPSDRLERPVQRGEINKRIYQSPHGDHSTLLTPAGGFEDGPYFYRLSIDSRSLGRRRFGAPALWSEDDRFLAVPEWHTLERNGETSVSIFDLQTRRQWTTCLCRCFGRPVAWNGHRLRYRDESYDPQFVYQADKEIDVDLIEDWESIERDPPTGRGEAKSGRIRPPRRRLIANPLAEFDEEDFLNELEEICGWTWCWLFREALRVHPDFKPLRRHFNRDITIDETYLFRHLPTGRTWALHTLDERYSPGQWRKVGKSKEPEPQWRDPEEERRKEMENRAYEVSEELLLHEIEPFTNFNHYGDFYLAVHKSPAFEKITPQFATRYDEDKELHWFRHKPTGELWILVRPYADKAVEEEFRRKMEGPLRRKHIPKVPYTMGAWKKAGPVRRSVSS